MNILKSAWPLTLDFLGNGSIAKITFVGLRLTQDDGAAQTRTIHRPLSFLEEENNFLKKLRLLLTSKAWMAPQKRTV